MTEDWIKAIITKKHLKNPSHCDVDSFGTKECDELCPFRILQNACFPAELRELQIF